MKASAFNGDVEISSNISSTNYRLNILFSATSMPTIFLEGQLPLREPIYFHSHGGQTSYRCWPAIFNRLFFLIFSRNQLRPGFDNILQIFLPYFKNPNFFIRYLKASTPRFSFLAALD